MADSRKRQSLSVDDVKQEYGKMKKLVDDREDMMMKFFNQFQNQNMTVKRQTEEMERKIEGLESTCNEYEEKITNLNDDVKNIEKLYKDAMIQIKDINEKHAKEMADMEAKFVAEINALNSTKDDLSKQLSDAQSVAARNKKLCDLNELTIKNLQASEQKAIQSKNLQVKRNHDMEKELKETKANEMGLDTKVKELKAKDRNACLAIIGLSQRNQDLESELKEIKAKLGLRCISLKEISDGSRISFEKVNNFNSTVLTVTKLTQGNGYWNLYSTNNPNVEPVILHNSDYIKNTILQFYINGELDLNNDNLNLLLPRLHSCTLSKLNLHGAIISYETFEKLAAIPSITSFKNVLVKNRFGTLLSFTEILKELPRIQVFEMDEISMLISSVMCQSLENLSAFTTLRRFVLKSIDPLFDLVAFGSFIKKHPYTEFELQYYGLSQSQRISVGKKGAEMRKDLPQNCKVVLKY